jgi:hypothetical protein
MIWRLPLGRLVLGPGSATLLLAGLAAAALGLPPAAGAPSAVNFVDSGQALGGNAQSSAVALGDLDGDGDPDAVVANTGGPSRVWISQGGEQAGAPGQFQAGQSLSSGLAVDVDLGDLDGDGDLDIFIVLDSVDDSNQVWINQGVASGTFSQTAQVFGDSLTTSVNLADLDGDNDLDAFVGRGFGQPSKVWTNDGAGQFTDSGQSLDSDSSDVALADFDGDGDIDAFSANGAANKLWINLGGDDDGQEGDFVDSGQTLGNELSLAVAAGELNGSPGPDIYEGNSATDKVRFNHGQGIFEPGGSASGGQSRDVALGDFDLDGDLDAFVAKGGANEVWINQGGDQGGALGDLDDSGLRLGDSFSEGLAAADLDGDGDLDVFVANWGAPNKVWLNQSQVANPGGFGWQVESVATRGNSGLYGALALDDQGRPHIAYVEYLPVQSGLDHRLHYAFWDGVQWQREQVDAAPVIAPDDGSVGLDLDSTGVAHIAYPAGAWAGDMQLRYARRTAVGWQRQTVDGDTIVGRHVNLAVNDQDVPHILYFDSLAGELLYATWDTLTWTAEPVSEVLPGLGIYNSLALDDQGRPHIAYIDQVDGLVYATRDGAWQTTVVDADPDPFNPYPDIALDPDGKPAISYIADLGLELRYAARDGVAWQLETARTVPLNLDLADRTALAFDAQGYPHIIHAPGDPPDLFLDRVYWDGGAWIVERLDNSGRAGGHADLAFDGDGNLHAAYYDRAYGDLRHIAWGPNWQTRMVAGGVVNSPALQVAAGQPGIGYYSQSGGQVQLARWQAGWQLNPADFVSAPVEQVSQAAGLNDRHISYYDADNQRLMYGRLGRAGWALQVIDEAFDVGRHNDMLLAGGSDDRPRFAYWDATFEGIKVAVLNPGSSVPAIYPNTAAPPLDAASGYPHIVRLPGDNLGVSYYDGVHGDLRFAELDPFSGAWSDGAVDGLLGANVGRLNDLQVDGTEGEPAAAYYDESNGAIKFAYRDGGAWQIETAVPVSGTVTALALELGLGSRTRARIAYATAAGEVLLAVLKEGSWLTTLIATGAAGGERAVSLDLDARPHLAFGHAADGLVYAFRSATLDLDRTLAMAPPADTGGYYNPLDACQAVLNFLVPLPSALAAAMTPYARPAVLLGGGSDPALFEALKNVFMGTSGGQHYIDLYAQHASEMGELGLADPALLWDAFGTLQNFLPGLEALVSGRGDEMLVTQQMVDDALDIWQRLAAAGSDELAQAINGQLAASNDLQDFVGLTFNQWAEAIGVQPPRLNFLPLVTK